MHKNTGALLEEVQLTVNSIIKGKEGIVQKALAAIIGGGHILMEDIPGVGKTTLATTLARTLSLDYRRVQFTPDVLPSDLLGFSMYHSQKGTFEFQKGAVFCNLLLADEINRTSPKTQSALLEVMEERQVSIEGETRSLPDPFIVIATENPSGSSGTQLLPESQLDRFLVCLSMGYPKHEDAVALLKGEVWKRLTDITPVLSLKDLKDIQNQTADIFVDDSMYEYIVNLVEATRDNSLFALGASPRAGIALLRMARAMAMLAGRDFVTATDVQSILCDVLCHRVRLSARCRAEGVTVTEAVGRLTDTVRCPKLIE